MKFKLCAFVLAVTLLSSCGESKTERQLADTIDSFAVNYFNCRYKEALPFVTSGSRKWIWYAATQMHQSDVNTLRVQEEGASCETESISIDNGDTTASATINAFNFYKTDTIGRRGHFVDKASFNIQAVKEGGKWKIRMEGLPQNGM